MQINPYLFYNGNCEAAFRYYAKVMDGEIEMMMTHEQAPPDMASPPEWKEKIMHARMNFGGEVLMGSDAPPGRFNKPQGFSVSIAIEDPAKADKIFHALADGGTVTMPIQKTFWAQRFGLCTDQFGIPWMVNCE